MNKSINFTDQDFPYFLVKKFKFLQTMRGSAMSYVFKGIEVWVLTGPLHDLDFPFLNPSPR